MATYYVATTGSDSNSGSISSPKATITAGINLMAPGDTLYIRGGTYNDHCRAVLGKSGTASARMTISGYPGETVTLRSSDGKRVFISGSSVNYWTFKDMVWDGINGPNALDDPSIANAFRDGCTGLIVDNIELKNCDESFLISGATDCIVRNCYFHDADTINCQPNTRSYGVYAHHGTNCLIENNILENNPGGGIQIYPGPWNGLIVRGNIIKDNNWCDTSQVGGIIVQKSSTNATLAGLQIYNNLIINNRPATTQSAGIGLISGSVGAQVYFNTIYGHPIGINIQSGTSGAIVRNNLLYGNDTPITNSGTGSTVSNNITTDPTFTNAAGENFHISPSGTAANTGTAIAGITVDLDDVTRQNPPDVGCYEAVATNTQLQAVYVSPSGSDSTGTGSLGAPYRTFAVGMRRLAAGGVLIMRGGAYTETTEYGSVATDTFGGIASSWATATTVKNFPGEAVTLTCNGINIDNSLATGGCAYFVIEGDTPANFVIKWNSSASQSGLRVNNAVHHIRFKNFTVQDFTAHGILGGSGTLTPDSIEIIGCEIKNCGTAQQHGISATRSSNWLIEKNYIHGNQGAGIRLYNSIAGNHVNATIRYNRVEGRKTGATGTVPGILVSSGAGHVVNHNVVNGQGSEAVALSTGIEVSQAGVTGAKVVNNTIHNVTTGILVDANAVNSVVKNNIISTTTTSLSNSGTGTSSSNNLTSSPSFTTPGSVFTLNTGSAALGGGVDVGLSANGTPDQGSYESMTVASAVVEEGSSSTIRITLNNNLWNPALPDTGVTGFTVRRNSTNNVITSATIVNDVVLLEVTTPITLGDTVDFSYSGGNLTDSANIGNTTKQAFAYTITNQSVTNNVLTGGTAPTGVTGLTVRRL